MFVTSERLQGGIRWKTTCSNSDIQLLFIPVTSLALIPRFSPRIITLVPGGPSAGEMPVTTGGGLILSITLAWDKRRNYNSDFHLSVLAAMFITRNWKLHGQYRTTRKQSPRKAVNEKF